MKKILCVVFLFFCSIVLSEEKNNEKLMEKFREKIRIEEQEKLKLENEKIEQARKMTEENQKKEKTAMEIMEKKRREHEESLEDKVYLSGNSLENQLFTVERAFKIAEQRISFIKVKEENEVARKKSSGLEENRPEELVSDKFNKLNEKYKLNADEIRKLFEQQQEIEEYLEKLEEMEKKIKD